jgi:hypothetical protein
MFNSTQGDQIGRFFCLLAIVFFGQFWKIKVTYILILTKNGVGYILGDFLTNSSGHPDSILADLDIDSHSSNECNTETF